MIIQATQGGDIVTVNFVAQIAASTAQTFISRLIKRNFFLLGVRMSFNLGQDRKVHHYISVSEDDSLPGSLPISGFNPLSEFSEYDYLTGNDDFKEVYCYAPSRRRDSYIKLFVDNQDVFEHDVDVQVFLEIL